MAPLSDLPPMPPIPDDELTATGRRLEPRKAARAERPGPDESERSVVTVRYNRRLGWWLVLGWPMYPAMVALSVYLSVSFGMETSFVIVLSIPPLLAAMSGTTILIPKNCLTYDVHRGRIETGARQVQSTLDRWRNGDRLEYSVYLGRLQIVRANGKRRDLVRNSILLDRDSWTAFVDVFLAHQNRREQGHQDTGSSLEDREPAATPLESEPAVSVGTRWRWFGGVLLGGLALTAIDLALWVDAPGGFDAFWPLGLMAAGYVLFGALPLIFNPVLTYKPGSGRVTIKARGPVAREFPHRGYERLEYSVYNGILYEVRTDGKRRRVAAGWAHELTAWKSFVDRFLEDHSPTEPRP